MRMRCSKIFLHIWIELNEITLEVRVVERWQDDLSLAAYRDLQVDPFRDRVPENGVDRARKDAHARDLDPEADPLCLAHEDAHAL